MGLKDFFKKNKGTDVDGLNNNIETIEDKEAERLAILSLNAENVVDMLKAGLKDDKGVEYYNLLLYGAGLAGYACQQAVIANNEPAVVLGTKDGRNYYFGDNVNAYLLESNTSILGFINGIYKHKTGSTNPPDPIPLIQRAVSVIGHDDYKIWDSYSTGEAYIAIKSCWDGIFEKLTDKVC